MSLETQLVIGLSHSLASGSMSTLISNEDLVGLSASTGVTDAILRNQWVALLHA